MSTTIHKFTLKSKLLQTVEMPEGAGILHAAIQRDQIRLWALVNVRAPMKQRQIRIVTTGEPFDRLVDDGVYIATLMSHTGNTVVHVFDLGEVDV